MSTTPLYTDPLPAPPDRHRTEVPSEFSSDENRLKELWLGLQRAEKHCERRGLRFGKACYELRGKAKVVSGGTTFRDTLAKLGIPHATAYRWIARYEELIGERKVPQSEPVASTGTEHGDEPTDKTEGWESDPDQTKPPIPLFVALSKFVTKIARQRVPSGEQAAIEKEAAKIYSEVGLLCSGLGPDLDDSLLAEIASFLTATPDDDPRKEEADHVVARIKTQQADHLVEALEESPAESAEVRP